MGKNYFLGFLDGLKHGLVQHALDNCCYFLNPLFLVLGRYQGASILWATSRPNWGGGRKAWVIWLPIGQMRGIETTNYPNLLLPHY